MHDAKNRHQGLLFVHGEVYFYCMNILIVELKQTIIPVIGCFTLR